MTIYMFKGSHRTIKSLLHLNDKNAPSALYAVKIKTSNFERRTYTLIINIVNKLTGMNTRNLQIP